MVTGKPISIEGVGVDPGTLYGTRGKGSWIRLAHLGAGFHFLNTGYAGRTAFGTSATFRDQPLPLSSAFQPLNADYDVLIEGSEAVTT